MKLLFKSTAGALVCLNALTACGPSTSDEGVLVNVELPSFMNSSNRSYKPKSRFVTLREKRDKYIQDKWLSNYQTEKTVRW